MPDETQAETTHAQAESETTNAVQQEGEKAAEKAVEKPAEQPSVKLTVEQYQAFIDIQREHAESKKREAAEAEKREQAKLKLMAEKDGVEKALEAQRNTSKVKEQEWEDRFNSLHQAIAQEKVDAVIAASISGKTFIGQTDEVRAEAARDFQALMRSSGRFSATQDAAGKWTVRETATGRDASEVLAEETKRKSYLFAATTQGGVENGGNATAAQQQQQENRLNPSGAYAGMGLWGLDERRN
jgi:hypothetical protein